MTKLANIALLQRIFSTIAFKGKGYCCIMAPMASPSGFGSRFEDVDGFAAREHLHQLGNAPGSCLGLYGRLDAPQNRIAIGRIDRCKEGLGLGFGFQRGQQVFRHRGGARAIVCTRPAPIRLG